MLRTIQKVPMSLKFSARICWSFCLLLLVSFGSNYSSFILYLLCSLPVSAFYTLLISQGTPRRTVITAAYTHLLECLNSSTSTNVRVGDSIINTLMQHIRTAIHLLWQTISHHSDERFVLILRFAVKALCLQLNVTLPGINRFDRFDNRVE